MEITINVPDELSGVIEGTLSDAIRKASDSVRRHQLRTAALESDEGVAEWAQQYGVRSSNMIIRAQAYEEVWQAQEFGEFIFQGDPRRPVLMKGSLEVLIRRYGQSYSQCANGWCYKVAKRYLRRMKFTSFEWSEMHDMAQELEARFNEKYYTSYHLGKWLVSHMGWGYENRVWLKGKLIGGLSDHQYRHIKMLAKIVSKTRVLDEQVAELKAWRQEQFQ